MDCGTFLDWLMLVPKCHVANGIVLPNGFRAVGTVNQDICTWGIFCGFLSHTILE